MSVKQCAECGRDFKPKHWHDKWCGEECKDIATKRRHRENNARYRARSPRPKAPSLQPRECPICGDMYTPIGVGQKSCEKFACRRAVGAYASRDSIEKCVVCGDEYEVKKGSYKQTCDKHTCVCAFNQITQQRAAQSMRAKKDEDADTTPPWKHDMKCPWEKGLFERDTLPHGVRSWDDPIMDPMSGGFPMRTFSAPVAREVAA